MAFDDDTSSGSNSLYREIQAAMGIVAHQDNVGAPATKGLSETFVNAFSSHIQGMGRSELAAEFKSLRSRTNERNDGGAIQTRHLHCQQGYRPGTDNHDALSYQEFGVSYHGKSVRKILHQRTFIKRDGIRKLVEMPSRDRTVLGKAAVPRHTYHFEALTVVGRTGAPAYGTLAADHVWMHSDPIARRDIFDVCATRLDDTSKLMAGCNGVIHLQRPIAKADLIRTEPNSIDSYQSFVHGGVGFGSARSDHSAQEQLYRELSCSNPFRSSELSMPPYFSQASFSYWNPSSTNFAVMPQMRGRSLLRLRNAAS